MNVYVQKQCVVAGVIAAVNAGVTAVDAFLARVAELFEGSDPFQKGWRLHTRHCTSDRHQHTHSLAEPVAWAELVPAVVFVPRMR
jgi:hypothetical protein